MISHPLQVIQMIQVIQMAQFIQNDTIQEIYEDLKTYVIVIH